MILTKRPESTWIKICGLRLPYDLELCIESGVDCIGMLIGKARRSTSELDILSWEDARRIASLAHGTDTRTALLCHNNNVEFLSGAIDFIAPKTVQFQFAYSEAVVRAVAEKHPDTLILQTVRVRSLSSFESIVEEIKAVDRNRHVSAVILDSPRGGSGLAFDWGLARRIVSDRQAQKIVLAGGVNPENVGEAISHVAPFGIDVMTGARSCRGKLEHKNVRQLVEAAHAGSRSS